MLRARMLVMKPVFRSRAGLAELVQSEFWETCRRGKSPENCRPGAKSLRNGFTDLEKQHVLAGILRLPGPENLSFLEFRQA